MKEIFKSRKKPYEFRRYNPNENKEKKGVLKTELEIETIGEPNVQALPEAERRTFFETLLARIKDLQEQDDK